MSETMRLAGAGSRTKVVAWLCVSLAAFIVMFPATWGVRRLTQGWIDIAASAGDETAFGLIMILQTVGGFLCLAGATVALLRWSDTANAPCGEEFATRLLRASIAGIALGIAGWAFLWWFKAIPPKLVYRGLLGPPSPWFALSAMWAGVVGGAVEEYYFRGFLLPLWRKHMPADVARWVSVGVFALWHLVEYRGPYHLVFVAVLGYVCTRFAEIDRTWWRAAVCHGLQNAAFYALANFKVLS